MKIRSKKVITIIASILIIIITTIALTKIYGRKEESKKLKDSNIQKELTSNNITIKTDRVQQTLEKIKKEVEANEVGIVPDGVQRTLDKKSKEEYDEEFINQTPEAKIDSQYTYRIYDDKCFISNNYGKTWAEVLIPIEKLCKVSEGNTYYNSLQEGSYIIDKEKIIFVYGGNQETQLSIIRSDDGGQTWRTIKVDEDNKAVKYVGLKFISFPSKEVGYIVVSSERVMGSERKIIYKTCDGGESFSKVETITNINEHCLYNAVFLTENLGFMAMVCNDSPEIYRTDDGGLTWEIIQIPQVEVDGITPFIQPELVFKEEGKLYLLVGQGDEGDYKGGTCKIKFISEDDGKSFRYTDEILD